ISATEPNRDGVASAPPPYRVSRVEQPVLPPGGAVATTPLDPRLVRRYAPDAPAADGTGIVASPTVDLAGAAIDRLSAVLTYAANLRVFEVSQALEQETAALLDHPRHDLSA